MLTVEANSTPDGVQVRIATDDSARLDALARLGFPIEGSHAVRTFPANTAHLDTAIRNLSVTIEAMVVQVLEALPIAWPEMLMDFLAVAAEMDHPYAVVGSCAIAIRGVPIAPGDIDVITTPAGVDDYSHRYRSSLVVPAATVDGFGRWARAYVMGGRLEWLGNPPRPFDGTWPRSAASWSVHWPFEEVAWQGTVVRVPPLAIQRDIEELRGRQQNVAAIEKHLAVDN